MWMGWVITQDDQSLDDKYVNTILSNHLRNYSQKETVTKLKNLFGSQKSIIHSRYQWLQYTKNDADDFTSYAAFQLSKLTAD